MKPYQSIYKESIDAICPVCDEHLGYTKELPKKVRCGNCGAALINDGSGLYEEGTEKKPLEEGSKYTNRIADLFFEAWLESYNPSSPPLSRVIGDALVELFQEYMYDTMPDRYSGVDGAMSMQDGYAQLQDDMLVFYKQLKTLQAPRLR